MSFRQTLRTMLTAGQVALLALISGCAHSIDAGTTETSVGVKFSVDADQLRSIRTAAIPVGPDGAYLWADVVATIARPASYSVLVFIDGELVPATVDGPSRISEGHTRFKLHWPQESAGGQDVRIALRLTTGLFSDINPDTTVVRGRLVGTPASGGTESARAHPLFDEAADGFVGIAIVHQPDLHAAAEEGDSSRMFAAISPDAATQSGTLAVIRLGDRNEEASQVARLELSALEYGKKYWVEIDQSGMGLFQAFFFPDGTGSEGAGDLFGGDASAGLVLS